MPGGWDRVREMIRENQTAMPVFASAPMLLQESLLFPYLSGAEFMHRFKDAKSGRPPWQPLPASTEQVMHFENVPLFPKGYHVARQSGSLGEV